MEEPAHGNALVIGGGVNELVCAHLLARAGFKVCVIAQHAPPGDGPDEEGWVPPALLRTLVPAAPALSMRHPDPWATVPLASGGQLELCLDPVRTAEAIRRVSPRDAQRWPEFCARTARLARLLERLYSAPPPDPVSREPRELVRLAGYALAARRLGRQGLEDLLRLLPMPVADWLEEWFECEALKGALAVLGVRDLHYGPRAGGTAFNLLHRRVGCPAGVFCPPRSNLRQRLEALPGIELRRKAQVVHIRVCAGRVRGAVLATGEEIAASLIVSGLDPRRTLLELVDPGWLDPELARSVRHIRRRGIAARVTVALGREPAFRRLVVAPSLDHLERAHDEAKYGRVSQAPVLEALLGDPDPDGRCRLHVRAQYAPYALAEGQWDEERRRALGATVLETLLRHAPGLGEAAVEQVLAPPDLEAAYGWPEGQPQHAELALDQALWMRPHPALARYRTPIGGLYLCGPAMHPGGDITGAAGANAAREILRDRRRSALD